MFEHNSKLACHVHEHHRRMDFENIEVVGHEAHNHQRLFLEACMSVKKTRTLGMITWSSKKSTSALRLNSLESRAYCTRNVSI